MTDSLFGDDLMQLPTTRRYGLVGNASSSRMSAWCPSGISSSGAWTIGADEKYVFPGSIRTNAAMGLTTKVFPGIDDDQVSSSVLRSGLPHDLERGKSGLFGIEVIKIGSRLQAWPGRHDNMFASSLIDGTLPGRGFSLQLIAVAGFFRVYTFVQRGERVDECGVIAVKGIWR